MSGSLLRLAIMQARLPRAETCIAIRIVDLQHLDEGVCKKSGAVLAEECGMSARAARRALQTLADLGWLESERNAAGRTVRRIVVPKPGRTPVAEKRPAMAAEETATTRAAATDGREPASPGHPGRTALAAQRPPVAAGRTALAAERPPVAYPSEGSSEGSFEGSSEGSPPHAPPEEDEPSWVREMNEGERLHLASKRAMASAIDSVGGDYRDRGSDREAHVEVGGTAEVYAKRHGHTLDGVLEAWAREWVGVVDVRSANSWRKFAASKAAGGTPWKRRAAGRGRGRKGGDSESVILRADPRTAPLSFGDADIPVEEGMEVRCG